MRELEAKGEGQSMVTERQKRIADGIANFTAVIVFLGAVGLLCAGGAYAILWLTGHDPYCPIAWGGAGVLFCSFAFCLWLGASLKTTVARASSAGDKQ